MKRYTPEKKQELVVRIDQFRKEGLKVKVACQKAGISDVSYYLWQGQFKPEEPDKGQQEK